MTDGEEFVMVRDVPAGTGVVRVFSINRPTKRNALNTEVIEGLLTGLVAADEDEQVRAIVITGEGGHFSGGGDLREFPEDSDPQPKLARAQSLADLILLPRKLNTPVIAAVRGATVGGAAALALAADMVVAGDDLALGFPELIRSIIPTTVMVGLARQVGSRFAFELLSTGRFLDAQEALEHRMLNRVVSAERTLEEAIELGSSLAAIETGPMRIMKRLFYSGQEQSDDVAMGAGMDAFRSGGVPVDK